MNFISIAINVLFIDKIGRKLVKSIATESKHIWNAIKIESQVLFLNKYSLKTLPTMRRLNNGEFQKSVAQQCFLAILFNNGHTRPNVNTLLIS